MKVVKLGLNETYDPDRKINSVKVSRWLGHNTSALDPSDSLRAARPRCMSPMRPSHGLDGAQFYPMYLEIHLIEE